MWAKVPEVAQPGWSMDHPPWAAIPSVLPARVAREAQHHLGHQGRPARLVRGAQALAGLGVEVLVELEEVLEVRVVGELLAVLAEAGDGAVLAREEDAREAALDLARVGLQVHAFVPEFASVTWQELRSVAY